MSANVPTIFGLTGRALHTAQVVLIGAPAFIVFG
jgi:hypothetical protein